MENTSNKDLLSILAQTKANIETIEAALSVDEPELGRTLMDGLIKGAKNVKDRLRRSGENGPGRPVRRTLRLNDEEDDAEAGPIHNPDDVGEAVDIEGGLNALDATPHKFQPRRADDPEIDSLTNEISEHLHPHERQIVKNEVRRLFLARQSRVNKFYEDLEAQNVKIHIRTRRGKGLTIKGENCDF